MSDSDIGDTAGTPQPMTCATCGAQPGGADAVAAARLTWTRGVEAGQALWACDRCSREHLRSIEGKLDSAWW